MGALVEHWAEKLYGAPFARALFFLCFGLLFFVLISSHLNLYTQLLIGYGAVLLLIATIPIKRRPKVLVLFVKLIGVLIVLRYLYWRTFDSLSYEGFWDFLGSLILYFAELVAIVIYLFGIFSSLRLLHRRPIPLSRFPKEQWPSVDILIPTYNEPYKIIENTLLAATGMDYPKEKYRIYLLDDGGTDQKCNDPDPQKAAEARARRASLQALCKKVGACYLTRPKNEHAKSGNLNHALPLTHGDLILVLDTDHVPAKGFLKKGVGWFLEDEKIFLVQTPHAFYNADPIERNLRMAQTALSENDMFYKYIQLGHDFWESSFFCGSAAILRRRYLQEVGGIAGDTITEDAETALELHNRGYKSAYLNEPMIRGLQPETLSAFLLQRIRWTQGMVQIFLMKNPLFSRLRWYQKISYLSASFFWFFAFSRVVFYLAPLTYLFFGLRIYNANSNELVAYVVPHMLVAILISYFLYEKVRNPFFSELYETVLSFFTLPAIFSVLKNPRAPKFKVTPKGIDLMEDRVSEHTIVFVILFTLIAMGFLFAIYRFIYYPEDMPTILMTTLWNTFNFVLLVAAIGAGSEKREMRHYIRIPLRTSVVIEADGLHIEGDVHDLSEGGLNITPRKVDPSYEKQLHHAKQIRVRLLDIDGEPFYVAVHFLKAFGWGKHLVFVFKDLEHHIEVKRKIIQLIYGNDTFWMDMEGGKPPLNPLQSFFYILKQGFKNAMIWEAYRAAFAKMMHLFLQRKQTQERNRPIRDRIILETKQGDYVATIAKRDFASLDLRFDEMPPIEVFEGQVILRLEGEVQGWGINILVESYDREKKRVRVRFVPQVFKERYPKTVAIAYEREGGE